jgi:DNA-directed RNA polymerase specialized sigma24 family protein
MITESAELTVRSLDPHRNLIESCKKGDHKAQLQVYRLYYKTMFNICRRIVNDPAEAEMIMQESFLDAFEEIEKYSGSENFDIWLRKFMESRLISLVRERLY